ncbi:hypothetical protein MUK42_10909 [Musa troglodytarum]|uniref:Drought induced 19 protein type zinc-binding domain-containing protein n=1 Tax=Musa troglodytarum TaxID=320322 RepID=A0A9E7GUA6_9LILI|nr:hypothetical protein MUK42_10909 [Musa troglodytarum]
METRHVERVGTLPSVIRGIPADPSHLSLFSFFLQAPSLPVSRVHGSRDPKPLVRRFQAPPSGPAIPIRWGTGRLWTRLLLFFASDYVIGGSDWGFLGLVDAYLGFEELDGGEDQPRPEFACPFCTEVFDVVGLCCHMDDEHPVESKNGVCPVCAARVGMDMDNTLEGNMQSLVGGSSFTPSNAAPDPLLSSFIFNLPVVDPSEDARSEPLDEQSMVDKISEEKLVESVVPCPLDQDREESARRSEFARQIVISTIFDET